MPEVSVLLVPGDEREAAALTVGDLLRQTLADFEILVMTPEAGGDWGGGEWGGGDPRVRVVPVAAGSVGAALNDGLAVAEGELIARATPGDVSTPERLARQAEHLAASGELGFVGAGWCRAEAGRVVRPPVRDAALRGAMAGGDAIGHPTAMMRRDAVLRAGGWRPAFAGFEDYDLLLRLMDRYPGACIPEVLVEHTPSIEIAAWRSVEQLILSEMAAVAAHDRRQAGRPDHGDRATPADRELLHRMGLIDEEISRVVLNRALSMAMAAGAAGEWRAMREAARLGLNQQELTTEWKSRFMGLWLRSVARVRPLRPGEEAPVS